MGAAWFLLPKSFQQNPTMQQDKSQGLEICKMDDYRIPLTSNGKQHEFAQKVPQIVFVQQSWRVDVGLDEMSNMTI